MSIPDQKPYDPAHCLACKAAYFEQRAKDLETERAAIVSALNDADWPNEGESTLDAVKALLVARNELARTVATLRGLG